MSVKVSPPIAGSARAREWELRAQVMGKRPANTTGERVEPRERVFTGTEGNAMVEAFGALWLAVREWWASWFELTPLARKVLRRTLWVAFIVWALIAPYAAGYFVGGYLLPLWVLRRLWRAYRAVKAWRTAKRERPKRVREAKRRSVTVSWG